ncbi:zinc finger protein 407-like isoform X2 [Phycodurus eques]|uniref:zinc finger protein 407-like isoform X2 n=1 Tax=Phycodurus eques TaxID=693459 RepID=UPI002ACE20E7|nr:zinc finger protein 407-like isoform X2 [Phycodurus eques]
MPKRGCPVVVHMDDVQAKSPSRAMTPEKQDGGPTQRLQADTVTEDVNTRCSVCDFSAKCPRSLKIHYARKHKKSTNKAAEPLEDRQTISDDCTREVQKEIDMETECPVESNPGLGPDDPRSASLDNDGGNFAISDKQAKQEQGISSQERRVSKRTPKPKIIYSCNFCGLEFRDKSPLDVHIQRYHSKDSPRTVDADVYMDEEDAETTESAFKITPAQGEPKRTGSRLKLNCANCDFKVFTVSLLESHARVKHPGLDWYRCKLCNFFSATSEWMDKHLCSDTHKQHMSRHNSASHSSYVERVAKGDGGEDGIAGVAQEIKEAMEAAKVVVDEEDLESEPPKPKRVRPKQASSTKCGYCGLVVSNATNLGVHVRRKHSKEYVYRCTLCCYSCVTKGDIDRHCITKKHRKRVQQCENSSPVKNLAGPLPQEPTDTQSQEPKEASFTRNMEQESQGSKKHSDEEQTLSYTCSVEGEYDSVACSHCNFIAHSVPSLDLHVKRKHTRDFEYVCLACRYYAVTTGEMSRHASTERHKQKSLKFQALQGNGGQKSLQSPAGLSEVIDLSGATVHVESEPLSLSDELKLSSEESQKEKNQYAVTPSVPVEPVDAVGMLADKAKEKKPESIASSSGDAQDVTHFTVEQTAEAANMPQAELEVVQSSQQEIQEKDDKFMEGTSAEKSSNSVPRMSTARPFDTCIVSVKALPKQEQASLEGVALEGEVVVKGLTGEAPVPSGLLSHYVKKLKHKEVSVETKVRSTRIRCADCGFLADGLSGLNVHVSMKHPTKDKQFHCMVCGKSFYTESNLHQHLASSSHLRNEQNSLDERDDGRACFKCTKCTDRFETEQDLFIHIKEKHDELLKQVNKYVIEDTEQINREREEHQGNKCKYCGKVCKSSNSMAFLAHIRTHTGIVSKSFECRLKGQGASFVETEVVDSSVDRKLSNEGDVQQVIIIQGYSDEEVAVDQTLEESAAATLQTLAMAGQMAEVLHITEDGQVIASGREVASAGAQLARGSTRYVVLSTGEAANELQATARGASEATGRSHIVSESSTALDALLSAVSKMDHQEKMLGEASAADEVAPPETAETVQSEARPLVKQEEEVQVINQTGQEDMQNLLQLAASRMIKEGLTQVIVNDEGTHYIVTELDNCTLQVEGGVYEVAAAGEQEAEGHHDDAP